VCLKAQSTHKRILLSFYLRTSQIMRAPSVNTIAGAGLRLGCVVSGPRFGCYSPVHTGLAIWRQLKDLAGQALGGEVAWWQSGKAARRQEGKEARKQGKSNVHT
jgi:hypothetical protein